MYVSGYMPQKIRVGRSENLFFLFYFFFRISDRCHDHHVHDQGIKSHDFFFLINEVIDSSFGLELKPLGISFTPYCANTGQIPIKTHFSVTFSSRVSSDRLRYNIKSARVGGKN